MKTVRVVARPCVVCHVATEMELDADKVRRWQGGEYVQNVWPEMDRADREVLISGTHGDCFGRLFGDMFDEEEQ